MFEITELPQEHIDSFNELVEHEKEEVSTRKVAVIAMYCNRFIWTRCCIPTLDPTFAGMDYMNYQLYLVNNNSTDSTAPFFNSYCEYRPFVQQVRHIENKGKPWAFNHTLKQIPDDVDYIVSIDGDIEMPKNWLRDMIICFEELQREGVQVGQLACDYELLPGCRKTVNPNTLHQPERCKILDSGIVLDTTPDVAGGCLIWEAKTLKNIGGYQVIDQVIDNKSTGKHNLYGMDDGLINLHLKRKGMLSCYLVNVKAKHWGDYDEALFPKYQDWKKQNLNPVLQSKIKPHEIGEEYEWNSAKKYEDIKDAQKVLRKCISAKAYDIMSAMYVKGCNNE